MVIAGGIGLVVVLVVGAILAVVLFGTRRGSRDD
jgi:hypothetical protein